MQFSEILTVRLTIVVKVQTSLIHIAHYFVDEGWKEGFGEFSNCLTSATKSKIPVFLFATFVAPKWDHDNIT